jgi:hypothetical protein
MQAACALAGGVALQLVEEAIGAGKTANVIIRWQPTEAQVQALAVADTAHVLACAALIRYRSGLDTRPLIASTSVSSSSLLSSAMSIVLRCSTAEAKAVQAYCTRLNNGVLSRLTVVFMHRFSSPQKWMRAFREQVLEVERATSVKQSPE